MNDRGYEPAPLSADKADAPESLPDAAGQATEEEKERHVYRGGDPAFGFLLAIAISIGLTPILPDAVALRYTLAWGALAAVGVLAWLLGNADRIGREDPVNVAWGVGFGVMVSVPFLLFRADTFAAASRLMFTSPVNGVETMAAGNVLAYLVFVMPLAETLFFRGLMQRQLPFWIVGVLAGIWSVVLFFPVMWNEIIDAPAVGIFLVIALGTLNMLYSYVRERNGLAAAWLTQITAGLLLFFVPFL